MPFLLLCIVVIVRVIVIFARNNFFDYRSIVVIIHINFLLDNNT
jgi:hypothetical protein